MPTSAASRATEVLLFLLPASESPEGAGWHAWCLYRHDGAWWVRYGAWARGDQRAGRLVKCSRPGKVFGPEDADRIKSERLARGYREGGAHTPGPPLPRYSPTRRARTNPPMLRRCTGGLWSEHAVPWLSHE